MTTTADLMSVVAGVADALLMGAPSSVAIGQLADEYNTSIAEATQWYNTVQAALGQSTQALEDLRSKRLSLAALIQSYPELNLLAQRYYAKRGKMLEEEANLKDRIAQLNNEANEASAKIADLSERKASTTAATVVKRWFNTGDTK